MAEVIAEYATHPEPKSLDAEGNVCDRSTRGLLQRRPVTASSIGGIGKESNDLEAREAGLVHDLDEVITEYPDPRRDPFATRILPVLCDWPAARLAKKLGLHPVTIKNIRSGRTAPHSAHKRALVKIAVKVAGAGLRRWRVPVPDDALGICCAYLEQRQRRGLGACQQCGKPLADLRARYCSAACRNRAYRVRRGQRSSL
jgi:hypothetical protein